MEDPIEKLIKTQNSVRKIKKFRVKYPPIQINKSNIEEIKSFYLFSSKTKFFPFVFIKCSSINLLGIIIARQTSDLLFELAKRLLIYIKQNPSKCDIKIDFLQKFPPKLIQYKIPNEVTNPKLILISKFDEIENFSIFTKNFQKIYDLFQKKKLVLVDLCLN